MCTRTGQGTQAISPENKIFSVTAGFFLIFVVIRKLIEAQGMLYILIGFNNCYSLPDRDYFTFFNQYFLYFKCFE